MKIKAKIAAAVSAGLLMATLLSGCQLSKIFGTDTTQPGDTATEAPVTARPCPIRSITTRSTFQSI